MTEQAQPNLDSPIEPALPAEFMEARRNAAEFLRAFTERLATCVMPDVPGIDQARRVLDEIAKQRRFRPPTAKPAFVDRASRADRRNQIAATIATRMSEHLAIRGLSARAMAKLSGLSSPTISKSISGRAVPSAMTLWRIARAINVKVDDLVR